VGFRRHLSQSIFERTLLKLPATSCGEYARCSIQEKGERDELFNATQEVQESHGG